MGRRIHTRLSPVRNIDKFFPLSGAGQPGLRPLRQHLLTKQRDQVIKQSSNQHGGFRHLKVLEHAGLITRSREAQWRPCRLKAGPLKDVSDWVEHYRRFWDESFDRLDEYLHELQAQTPKTTKQEKE